MHLFKCTRVSDLIILFWEFESFLEALSAILNDFPNNIIQAAKSDIEADSSPLRKRVIATLE